jgi:hypothetical protein
MKSQFLSRLFSMAEFPPHVLDAAIATYAPRYLDDFMKNGSLGAAARPMVENFLESGDGDAVIAMIRTKNQEVLRELLTRPGTLSDKILFAVVDIWDLSDQDAAQLCTHTTSKSMTDYLPVAVKSRIGRTAGGEATTLRNESRRGWTLPLLHEEGMNKPLGRLGAAFEGEMVLVSRMLVEGLGDGRSEVSLQSWMNFFGLAESSSSVLLKTVISVSTTLAFAEL